jgi:hypothetical protein
MAVIGSSDPERASSGMAGMYRLFRAIPLHFFSFFSHPDSGKEIKCRFVIDPFVDFDFVDPIQVSDLVFDLFSIHKNLTGISCSYSTYRRSSPILL